jgi:threonine dehydratase
MELRTLLSVTSDDVREAADRIGPYVRRTPVFATEIGGRPVTLKLENLQVTGSFKFRGALNGVIARGTGGPACPRGDTVSSGDTPDPTALKFPELCPISGDSTL